MRNKSLLIKETRELVKEYAPYMHAGEVLNWVGTPIKIERELRFLRDSLDDLRDDFSNKFMDIWEIPQTVTLDRIYKTGITPDLYWATLENFWEGAITESDLVNFMLGTLKNE